MGGLGDLGAHGGELLERDRTRPVAQVVEQRLEMVFAHGGFGKFADDGQPRVERGLQLQAAEAHQRGDFPQADRADEQDQ